MKTKILPQDLRIGNILMVNNDGDERPSAVNYISKDYNGFKGWFINFGWCTCTFVDEDGYWLFRPININHRWLNLLGFHKHENVMYGKYYNIQGMYGILVYDNKCKCWELLDSDERTMVTNLKYIHQLQNLFHSFTGKELHLTFTIKNKSKSNNKILFSL